MSRVKEILMFETMVKNFIISNERANTLIDKINTGDKHADFVHRLIYKIWNRKYEIIKNYEQVIESGIKNIFTTYKDNLRAHKPNMNFLKTESYCLMNRFSQENVEALKEKVQHIETYSD